MKHSYAARIVAQELQFVREDKMTRLCVYGIILCFHLKNSPA